MKPNITYRSNVYRPHWVCRCKSTQGLGVTPTDAYKRWADNKFVKKLIDDFGERV